MKAALLTSYGETAQLSISDLPKPQPGDGDVRIRIRASALNPFDQLLRSGYMKAYVPLGLPAILGSDAAGTVEAVGPGVTGFAAGDRVIADFAPNGQGAQAEYGVVPVTSIAHLPASLTFAKGAALVKAGLMGRQVVAALDVRVGDRVLVSGALGAVGRAAIQYLKEIGGIPVAGVRPGRLDEGRHVAGEALDITVEPTQATFNLGISAAAPVAAKLVAHIRDGGTIGSIVPVPDGVNTGNRVALRELYHRTDAASLQAVVEAAAHGNLTIPVAATFAFAEVNDAYAALVASPAGKIILEH